jgi:hypothetical protein
MSRKGLFALIYGAYKGIQIDGRLTVVMEIARQGGIKSPRTGPRPAHNI